MMDKSKMRFGFTTGSCATAASKAATYMLLTGKRKESITIETPKGIDFPAEILEISQAENTVSCAVRKDGGDDPDVTTGSLVYSKVTITSNAGDELRISIDGGVGVGRVTRPGLDQPVGNAAINSVPRSMIEREVRSVCELCDFHGCLEVIISIPDGVELAKKTFNPRLGIEGGISVLGTSGVVEPMSAEALIATIKVELRQKKAEGYRIAPVSPGNYGLDFMKKTYDFDLDKSVKCSNFVGVTIDLAAELGFEGILLTGHAGKIVKLAGGIMNTHSHEADCRMELIAVAAARSGASTADVCRILDAYTTEEAFMTVRELGLMEPVSARLMEKIGFYLDKRAAGRLEIQCMMYLSDFGLIGQTSGAESMLNQIMQRW